MQNPLKNLGVKDSKSQSDPQPHGGRWLRYIVWVLGVGLGAIAVYALQFCGKGKFWAVFGGGVLLAFEALFLGGIVGLLFGMPSERKDQNTNPGQQQPNSPTNHFQLSTKFLEIADWLTKIIVGVGLVELAKIGPKLGQLAVFLAPVLGNAPESGKPVALAILLSYLGGGFLLGFLWANFYLPNLLDTSFFHLQDKVSQLETWIMDYDANALILSERWLTRHPDDSPPARDREEMKTAIEKASPTCRYLVFNQAYELLRPEWTRAQRMERRVAVYDALVAQDTAERFYRNRGQLGIALATQTTPDFKSAEKWLNDAIRIRDTNERGAGWLNYEFYRAYVRIKQASVSGAPVLSADAQKAIVDDLKKARTGDSCLQHRIQQVVRVSQAADEYLDDDINTVRGWIEKADPQEFENWRPQLLYFAYGSNMLDSRLQSRAPSARFLTKARLADYRFDFSKRGGDGSGKGNIRPDHGAGVWGVVFAMSFQDKPQLDRAENGYDEMQVTVTDENGKRYSAFAYVGQNPEGHSLPPTEEYKNYVLQGAKKHNLPDDYIADLEALAGGSPRNW